MAALAKTTFAQAEIMQAIRVCRVAGCGRLERRSGLGHSAAGHLNGFIVRLSFSKGGWNRRCGGGALLALTLVHQIRLMYP